MQVLHFYPSNEPVIAQYVSMLTAPADNASADDVKTFRQKVQEQLPDIVHLHGCRNAEMLKATEWARRQGCRIVITPHGELQQWEQSGLSEKYSHRLLLHTYVLIVRSPMEADAMTTLGYDKRIEVVPNPIITRTTTAERLKERYKSIYQRVMDSNILELMDQDTRIALRKLLKAGITQDERWVEPFDPTTVNWHKLFIYADLEGVMPYVDRGMMAMRITQSSESHIATYLPDTYQHPEARNAMPLFDIIKSLYDGYRRGQLALLSIVELDLALRRDDVEDDVLMQMLVSEKLDGFFASLLTILSEQTGIEEGFMPCVPADNQITQKIRTIIKKHLEI